MPNSPRLQAILAQNGLRLRGHWPMLPADTQLPQLPRGNDGAVMCLVGVVGSEFWPHFKASAQFQDGAPDPLDRWSRAIGDALASALGGLALYPFDGPPWHPFQQWADRCEPTQASRMMLRIHPQYGLWHAYRFALLLPPGVLSAAPALAAPAEATSLCASCDGQPCLQPCPVQAYTGSEFRLQACADHVHSPQGGNCMAQGCQARLACPVGVEFRYQPEHAAFHMQAFASAHPATRS